MKAARHNSAFTLIELLVVIAIIAVLAALAMPALNAFKAGDAMVAVTRQMLDDVERARQLAISQRTTVYMIFCPSNYFTLNATELSQLPTSEQDKAKGLYDKQLEAYTYVAMRSVGEQPGQVSPRYLTPWRSLPDGTFIPVFKFAPRTATPTPIYDPPQPNAVVNVRFQIRGFTTSYNIPFPSADAYDPTVPNRKFVTLPYIAFNSQGQLESKVDEYIPLARGKIIQAHNSDGVSVQGVPVIKESPIGNSTNAFFVIHIDALTGRARLEKQEVQ